eukprot:s271_g7.t1
MKLYVHVQRLTVPRTVAGKLTAVTTMFLGTIIMAVCIAVITNSFTIQYQRELYLARMRRLQQRAEEHGHTNLSPLTPQRARFYSKDTGCFRGRGALEYIHEPSSLASSSSRRRLTRPITGEVVRAPPSDRFVGGEFEEDDDEDPAENDDIASFVKELEEMTEALLLTFEALWRDGYAYLDQGEAKEATPHTSRSRQSGLGRVALDMLRKNSHVWPGTFGARSFSQELATWATDDRDRCDRPPSISQGEGSLTA